MTINNWKSTAMTKNLEVFSLIWCDANQDTLCENRQTQEKLRDFINFQKTFTSVDECEQYVCHETTVEDKIILISSGALGHILIPKIHDKPSIKSIYIYCLNEANKKEWIINFSKVTTFLIYDHT